MAISMYAQSPFKHMPIPQQSFKAMQGLTVNPEVTTYRFSAPTAMFLYPQKQIGTSLGFGYNKMHYIDSTKKWYTDLAINASIIAAGNTVPSPTNVMSVGLFVSFLNQLIQVGPIYNLPSGGNPKGTFGVGFALGVSLN